MRPTLAAELRSAALNAFMDYAIANERGFIVAMTSNSVLADQIAASDPRYTVHHLSDINRPAA